MEQTGSRVCIPLNPDNEFGIYRKPSKDFLVGKYNEDTKQITDITAFKKKHEARAFMFERYASARRVHYEEEEE